MMQLWEFALVRIHNFSFHDLLLFKHVVILIQHVFTRWFHIDIHIL